MSKFLPAIREKSFFVKAIIPITGLLLVISAYLSNTVVWLGWEFLLSFVLLLSLGLEVFSLKREPILNSGAILLATVYTGGLFSHLVMLRQQSDGLIFVLLVIFVIWASDTAAYFAGCAYGRRKLLPHVSPNKTWEGALAGFLAGIVMGLLVSFLVDYALILGTIIAVTAAISGQIGDLAASAIKRASKVKDTGGILPGHGGIIDRFDSMLFAAFIVYYVSRIIGA